LLKKISPYFKISDNLAFEDLKKQVLIDYQVDLNSLICVSQLGNLLDTQKLLSYLFNQCQQAKDNTLIDNEKLQEQLQKIGSNFQNKQNDINIIHGILRYVVKFYRNKPNILASSFKEIVIYAISCLKFLTIHEFLEEVKKEQYFDLLFGLQGSLIPDQDYGKDDITISMLQDLSHQRKLKNFLTKKSTICKSSDFIYSDSANLKKFTQKRLQKT
jgi:hypothetical protein